MMARVRKPKDLLLSAMDKLKCLQAGKFQCTENYRAIEHIGVALTYLKLRPKTAKWRRRYEN